MEKSEIKCLKCEKTLNQSVCIVDDAALITVDFNYLSKYYGNMLSKAYICEECYSKNPHLFVK